MIKMYHVAVNYYGMGIAPIGYEKYTEYVLFGKFKFKTNHRKIIF